MAVDHAAELAKEIADLIAPLRERDEQLTTEIEERKRELVELNRVQHQVRSLIRTTDPTYQKRTYKLNGRPKSETRPIDEVRADRMGEWLVKNADEVNAMNDGSGFYGTGLYDSHRGKMPKGISSQSAVSKCLFILHQRGTIRLMQVNVGTGGAKFYKVVT